jgi:hypothetical protein
MAAHKKTVEQKRLTRRNKEKRYREKHPHCYWLHSIKSRAALKGLEFNLTKEDLVVPEYCPVLGIKLARGVGKVSPSSPQVDRIDNNRGYVKGNVRVISQRANGLKSDATIEELITIVLDMVKHVNEKA